MSITNENPDLATIDSPPFNTTKKRRLSSQPKFYAVRAGHNPGVYLTWAECEQNITKFKNALFKTFPTRPDAEAFVAGLEPPSLQDSAAPKFYGVAVGRQPGVYTDWISAQQQIKGWKGPKYKKFTTKTEAEAFVESGGMYKAPKSDPKGVRLLKKSPGRPRKDASIVEDKKNDRHVNYDIFVEDDLISEPETKKVKVGQQNDFLNARIESPLFASDDGKLLIIHTDGSCLGNGKTGATAGVGVYFGEGDPRNVAERLQGGVQTNQRAELTAVLRALQISRPDQEVQIRTDSRYSIDCVTVWFQNWERNEWQTSLKKPVLNRDLIQAILAKIREREVLGTGTRFHWVKGHANDPNNEAADRLAVRGAKMPLG